MSWDTERRPHFDVHTSPRHRRGPQVEEPTPEPPGDADLRRRMTLGVLAITLLVVVLVAIFQ